MRSSDAEGQVGGSVSAPSRLLVLAEILTVGFPFCVFKLVCGFALWTAVMTAAPGMLVRLIAVMLVVVGAVDVVANLGNGVGVLLTGRRPLPTCLAHAVGRVLGWRRAEEVGTAVDMALSFVLVAVMIGGGGIATLASTSPTSLQAWNVAVVLNVLGAGGLRLVQALRPATD